MDQVASLASLAAADTAANQCNASIKTTHTFTSLVSRAGHLHNCHCQRPQLDHLRGQRAVPYGTSPQPCAPSTTFSTPPVAPFTPTLGREELVLASRTNRCSSLFTTAAATFVLTCNSLSRNNDTLCMVRYDLGALRCGLKVRALPKISLYSTHPGRFLIKI